MNSQSTRPQTGILQNQQNNVNSFSIIEIRKRLKSVNEATHNQARQDELMLFQKSISVQKLVSNKFDFKLLKQQLEEQQNRSRSHTESGQTTYKPKTTRLKELDVEFLNLQQEYKRLKEVINSMGRFCNVFEGKEISEIINENIISYQKISEQQKEILNLKHLLKRNESEKKQLILKRNLALRETEKLQQELLQLKSQILPALNDSQIRLENQKLRKSLQEKEYESQKYFKQSINWCEKYNEINTKYNELIIEYNQFKNEKIKEKQELKEKILSQEKEIQYLQDHQVELSDQSSQLNNSKEIKQNKKKVKRVNQTDVAKLGKEIRLRLMNQSIEYEKIENFLLNEISISIGQIQLSSLIRDLMKEPFYVKNIQEATLLGRYLVEDNNEEYINLDLNQFQETKIIVSILKQLIGKYELLNRQDNEQSKTFFSNLSQQFIFQILDGIKQSINHNHNIKEIQDTFDADEIFDSLKMLKIELSRKQKDYLELQIFKYCGQLQKIKYQELLEILQSIRTN